MNEVATFVSGVNQFEGGETAYACVAFSAALIFYSTAPGTSNTYTPEQVDQLADFWYAREEGDATASNTNGMGMNELHDMLNGMNLPWKDLGVSASSQHDSDIAAVKSAIVNYGYPVMICGAETGFYDVGLGDIIPYGWTPTGNHCIVASGVAPSGNLLVRDMANVGHGLVPGSLREYDNSKMFLISATAIIPHWIGAKPVAMNVNQRKAFEQEWISIVPDAMLTSGIANAAWAEYRAGNGHGPALSREFPLSDWNSNKQYIAQVVVQGIYLWDGTAAHYHPYK